MTRMSGRVSASAAVGETEVDDLDPSVRNKVQQLERAMKILRAEMDMKMKIMEQILNTRNDQFVVHRKLLDREEAIYQTVLAHWKNTSELAARGLFLHFSLDNAEEINDDSADASDEQDTDYVPSRGSKSSASARRLRKRKLRSRRNTERSAETIYGLESQRNCSEEEYGEGMEEDVVESQNVSDYMKLEDTQNDLEVMVQDDSKKRKQEDLPATYSFQEEAELILAVEKTPYLWDSSHKDYKNFKKKYTSWKSIAHSFHKSVNDTQQCWSKLRQQYVSSLRKIRRGRMVNFRHSEVMDFIKPRFRPTVHSTLGAKYSDGDGENSENNAEDSTTAWAN